MSFTVTLTSVVIMLLQAVPGYLLVKKKLLPLSSSKNFAVYLLYVNTPALIISSMQKIDYSPYMLKYMGIALIVSFVMMAGGMAIMYLIMRSRQQDVAYRICVCATTMGNVGFMGVPLLQTLLPDYPQMQSFASMFFLTLNVIMWSLSSWIMTRDKRYMSLRKALVNPAVVSVLVGLALFLGRIRLPQKLGDAVSLLSSMSTPICMLMLGMRLASMPLKPIFANKVQYIPVVLKLIVLPLVTLVLGRFLPVERDFIRGLFILSTVPVGNTVLSFAELLGEGQDVAANVVLLSTILCTLTIPCMMLLI